MNINTFWPKRRNLLVMVCLFLSIFTIVTKYQLYRLGAFGCFDDCANIVAGYFITQGKVLYRDIFFNHQPIFAYVSAFIQYIFPNKSLYQLIYFHRILLVAVSFVFDLYFILRYKKRGFFIAVFYEISKYYIFGNRFLAEAFIVYPLIFLTLLIWKQRNKQQIFGWEYIMSGFFTWFIVFSREPYILSAILLYIFLIIGDFHRLSVKISTVLTCAFTGYVLIVFPISDYFFNVIYVNSITQIRPDTLSIPSLSRSFFYPLFLAISIPRNIFHWILTIVSIVYIFTSFLSLKKKTILWSTYLFFWLVLGITNIRVVPIGTLFYDSFHMIPWYGLFIVNSVLLVFSFENTLIGIQKSILVGFSLCMLSILVSPGSYLHEKTNPEKEFNDNYANYYVNGEVIKILSDSRDTFFVEMWDDLMYIQTKLPSSYRYSWYTSVMPFFPIYTKARYEMFEKNPPVFYYGNCRPNESYSASLPENMQNTYIQLLFSGHPSCIYIKKTKIETISQEKIQRILKFGYSLPK